MNTHDTDPIRHDNNVSESGPNGPKSISISEQLGSLTLSKDTVLDPHQVDAFYDAVDFYKSGGKECYIVLPTGSGKTVIATEICRVLLDNAPSDQPKPRIIILEPTIGLTNQTRGSIDPETGKKRGFIGFAPDLDTRAIHSQTPKEAYYDNLINADILVTTYDTFRKISADLLMAGEKTEDEWQAEKLKHLNLVDELEAERQRLIVTQKKFVKDAYQKQKLNVLATRTQEMLSNKTVLELNDEQIYHLESINELATSDNPASIPALRIRMRKLHTTRIKEGIRAYDETIDRAKKRREESRKRKEAGLPRLLREVDEQEEIGKVYKKLSPSEAAIMQLTLDIRTKDKPTTSDLISYKDSVISNNYISLIQQGRSKIIKHKKLAKNIDHILMLKKSAGEFGFIICDEAHRAIGTETWSALRKYAHNRDIAIMGLTATDKYYDRHLEDYFEERAHELTKIEAIKRNIINPTAIFVHNTGLSFKNVEIAANGDYATNSMGSVRFNKNRNMDAVNYAKKLSEQGYQGIMSAIPGAGGEHARLLAELINKQEIIDPRTGQKRLLKARCVLQHSPKREEYYKDFEAGKLDWLTFVDVIREGWDSDKAKALINTRITRSPLLATQRAGRVGRTYEGAPVSIVIDFYDDIESDDQFKQIPPVLMTDVYSLGTVEQGYIIGEEHAQPHPVLDILRKDMTQPIQDYHNQYVRMLETVPIIDPRGIASYRKGIQNPSEWQTFEAIEKGFKGFLQKEVLIEAVTSDPPKVRTMSGRSGQRIIPLFNISDVLSLQQEGPLINPWKLYIDESGDKWITPQSCTTLLSKRFPHLQADDVITIINAYEAEMQTTVTKQTGRFVINFDPTTKNKHGLVSMYTLNEVIEKIVPYAIELGGLN